MTVEAMPVQDEVSLDDLFANTKKNGEIAVNAFHQLQAQGKTIRDQQTARKEFCAVRGINLDKLIDRLQTNSNSEEKENKYVLEFSSKHAASGFTGFTMDELIKSAKKDGFIPEDKKEYRQPLYRAVIELKDKGLFKEASFKRDDKTVFISVG